MNKRNKELNNLTKESLALAAAKLLQNHKELSISEICIQAGTSRNAYYRNFDSIEEVLKYYLVLKWESYSKKEHVIHVLQNQTKHHLIYFFYSEREYIRLLKNKNRLHLLEELFTEILISKDVNGAQRYYSYGITYLIFGFIRAMIDEGFVNLPEEIETMLEEFEKGITDKDTSFMTKKFIHRQP